MKPYAQDNFARNSTRVRSPISQRRARRLARFGLVSVVTGIAGIAALLMTVLGS
jgi:hypothetical protein